MLIDGPIGKQSAYHIVEKEAAGASFHRGDEVYIAGEPGMRFYRVIGSDPAHGIVTIVDASGATHHVPESALAAR